MRSQLPVHSPLSAGVLASGALAAAGFGAVASAERLRELFLQRHFARDLALTDSGTSALVSAFRICRNTGVKRVACPAYVCVDVGAAAQFAGVELVLYDTDPHTLGPDLDSLERVAGRGMGAVLVAHLYGLPAPIDEIRSFCTRHGMLLIEDAAQEAGASLNGVRLGSFGDLAVLSFGRGKGATGGGGALLVSEKAPNDLRIPQFASGGAGWGKVVTGCAQYLLGRPALYSIPLSIPWLNLGEMIYHPAHEPAAMSRASASMVLDAMPHAEREIPIRKSNAARLNALAMQGRGVRGITPARGAEPSWLRFPVVDLRSGSHELRDAGITRGYPRLLNEERALEGIVATDGEQLSGAAELAKSLFTLPTHSLMRERDFEAIEQWLRREQ